MTISTLRLLSLLIAEIIICLLMKGCGGGAEYPVESQAETDPIKPYVCEAPVGKCYITGGEYRCC